jgi:putative ABC transport system substrate-binding protein
LAATCGWTFGGTAKTAIGYERSHRSWSACNPEIILATGATATVAVQRETRTIPIVFGTTGDPVASAIVTRPDRPSGNITGFGGLEPSMGGKWLELLSEITPELKWAATIFNPEGDPPISTYMPSFETAARSLKVEPIIAAVHSDVEIETAIIALGREPGGGLVVVGSGGFTAAHRAAISYRRPPETTYRRSITYLPMPETAACSLTDPTR